MSFQKNKDGGHVKTLRLNQAFNHFNLAIQIQLIQNKLINVDGTMDTANVAFNCNRNGQDTDSRTRFSRLE